MGWSLSDLGIAGFTLVGVVPALIIIGVVFAVGGVALYLAGLVSAVIYFLAGIGVLWILKAFGVFRNLWGFLFLLILPVMALWGWGVDNISFLSAMPSPANWLSSHSTISLGMNDLNGAPIVFVMTYAYFGLMLASTGLIIALLCLVMRRRKRRHR